MGTCSSASSSKVVNGRENYTRLCRLLVDVGVQALRDTFDKIHPPAYLHEVLANSPAHATLQSLRKKMILNVDQWMKLFPTTASSVSSANFDATLLILLLKNICNLSCPTTGWDSLPPTEDATIEANIARLLFYRDEVCKHASQAFVDNPTFESYWLGITKALEGIGAGKSSYEAAINLVKAEYLVSECDKPCHDHELLEEWKKDDDIIKDKIVESEEADKNKQSSVLTCDSSPPQLSIKLPKPSDIQSTWVDWSEVELPVDVILLTAEEWEFISCFAYLDAGPMKSYSKETGYVYFGSMGGGDQGKLKIALLQCSRGTAVPSGSLATVKNAVKVLGPRAVFSVGACSGLSPERAKLGDVVVSSKLTTSAHRTPVSRNMGYLIKDMKYGWVAPLENRSDLEVVVHCDGDILSQELAARFGWRVEDIMRQHPEATAVETEGEGVFAAAYDDNVEWIIVKGVASYGDLSQSSTKDWTSFASTMAASLVAYVLKDDAVFREWRHASQGCYTTQGQHSSKKMYINMDNILIITS